MKNEQPSISLLGQLYLYFNPDYHKQLIDESVRETIAYSRTASQNALEEAETKSGLPPSVPRRFIVR